MNLRSNFKGMQLSVFFLVWNAKSSPPRRPGGTPGVDFCAPGVKDCGDLTDEGRLCATACEGDNGGCAHKCQKTPREREGSGLKRIPFSDDDGVSAFPYIYGHMGFVKGKF
ncbi:hypothetical protein JTE90_016074 [Oedothorax gibbosus]|uniref:WAP domain-containing protein n=1 Tax=Oedothorax gibbosus TaxID=931172 RepID=A0AAV6TCW4_9ARAC|nr:hypothetical protein JTE90_016074 [Oedothorax gibbosus]